MSTQRDLEWLRTASTAGLRRAYAAGELNDLIGADVRSDDQLTAEDLNTMAPEAIAQAEQEGRLDLLLGRRQDAAPTA